jgi:hypothetical protein
MNNPKDVDTHSRARKQKRQAFVALRAKEDIVVAMS